MPDEKIKDSRELEFAIFCIENVAAKLGVHAELVYRAFTEKSNVLNVFNAADIAVILFFGRSLISIFNSDPQVVEVGCV